jgi:hypothetical protein
MGLKQAHRKHKHKIFLVKKPKKPSASLGGARLPGTVRGTVGPSPSHDVLPVDIVGGRANRGRITANRRHRVGILSHALKRIE